MPEPRILMTGIALGESPRWHDGRLWFSDWGAREIIAVDKAGKPEVMLRDVANLPFCFDWLPDGRLLIVAGRDGRLLRQDADGSLVTHGELDEPSSHPWNEIVVDGRGNVYLNNTGFDFPTAEFAPGFIACMTPDGTIRRVAEDFAFPNGMAVTPDNATLIVAESYAGRLTAFDLAADGSLSNRRVWAEIPGSAPDGICLDAEDTVWYADVPNRCCVRVAEGGHVLKSVEIDRGCFACMLGGSDGRTLFMLAADWHGPSSLGSLERTGQLLSTSAPAVHAGWP